MKAAQIQKVAVVGTGLMGHGIAQAFAQAGFQVNVTDASESALAVVKDRIRSNLVTFVEGELISQNEAAEILARIHVFPNLGQAIREADFVTEAIYEDLEVKQSIFEEMDKHCSLDTILASNTSSFRMTDLSSRMQNPERAIITHWFNPPHLVPLVEVVLGRNTSEETVTGKLFQKQSSVSRRGRVDN